VFCVCVLGCVSEFEEILRAWQWPFIMSTVSAPVIPKAAELREQLGPVCHQLACLHLPYPLLVLITYFWREKGCWLLYLCNVVFYCAVVSCAEPCLQK